MLRFKKIYVQPFVSEIHPLAYIFQKYNVSVHSSIRKELAYCRGPFFALISILLGINGSSFATVILQWQAIEVCLGAKIRSRRYEMASIIVSVRISAKAWPLLWSRFGRPGKASEFLTSKLICVCFVTISFLKNILINFCARFRWFECWNGNFSPLGEILIRYFCGTLNNGPVVNVLNGHSFLAMLFYISSGWRGRTFVTVCHAE